MAKEKNNAELAIMNDQNMAAFESFLSTVPEVDEGSYENILVKLMNASNVYELDSPFTTDSLAEYKDQPIDITSIRQAPSEFAGGLGVYLLIDLVDLGDGSESTVSTGSVSIVAQLVRANTLGLFPLRCIPRVAKKPTKKGYYPQHLEIIPQGNQEPASGPSISAEEQENIGF